LEPEVRLKQGELGGEEEARLTSELITPLAHIEPVPVDHDCIRVDLTGNLQSHVEGASVVEWVKLVVGLVLAIPYLRVGKSGKIPDKNFQEK